MKYNGEFAALLNHHLRERDRTATWLAKQLHMSHTTVLRWTTGQTLPQDAQVILQVADKLGIHDEAGKRDLVNVAGFAYKEQWRGIERTDTSQDDALPVPTSSSAEGNRRTFVNQAYTALLHGAALYAPEPLAERLFAHFYAQAVPSPNAQLISPLCGNRGLDLAHRRLFFSTAFGTYFTGLLERDQSYTPIAEQVDSPAILGSAMLGPIERIIWALEHPQGPGIIVFAADGGMGKSTLAAKVLRCLVERQAIDTILGDSAKRQQVDPVSGEILAVTQSYADAETFYAQLFSQLRA